jgi:geranylgeranylglycerol-phosphate geranylgeranyltransferase
VSITESTIKKSPLLADLLAVSHIYNGVASAGGAAIGYLATAWYFQIPVQVMAVLAAAGATLLVSNAGFIVNDIFDLPIDRINRPDRPLAAGRISVQAAWILYAVYNAGGILLALSINTAIGFISLITALGLFLYSFDLKKRFLIGHLVVATFGSLLLPFGGLAAGRSLLFLTFPVTFCAFFAREVLKTVPDAEGDRAHGVVNITTHYGESLALRLAQVMFALCALTLPLLRLFWELNNWFLVAVIIIIWPVTLFLLVQLSQPDHKQVITVLRVSKLLFLLVALAILIGSFR